MPSVRAPLSLLAALSLAFPAAAAAQGAADNQYTDPFGSSPPPTTTHTATAPAPAPAAASTPALSSTAPSGNGDGASDTTAAPSASASDDADGSTSTLPYTGSDPLEEAAIGAVLVLAGAAVALRGRHASGP